LTTLCLCNILNGTWLRRHNSSLQWA
jgi:hypothetical protein